MKRDILYIVMPAYNEEANIEGVVRSWYAQLAEADPQSRLVVADSGSRDRTHAILTGLMQELPQLEVLEETAKEHGPKLLALYRYAAESGADYIFQTDSDGQTRAEEFPAFWQLRENYDAILGSRPVRGDGPARAFVEKVVCFLVRLYFGVKVPDANAPFRLMRSETVAKYLDRFQTDYNIPNIMFTVFFVYYRDRVVFRDITFRDRAAGTNSINIPRIVGIGRKALKDFRGFKKGL